MVAPDWAQLPVSVPPSLAAAMDYSGGAMVLQEVELDPAAVERSTQPRAEAITSLVEFLGSN